MSEDDEQPVPERIRDVIEQSEWPELSIREIMERTGLSKDQVLAAAGSMDRLELDRSVGAVRLPEDSGGEFVDDHEKEIRTDGGSGTADTDRECPDCGGLLVWVEDDEIYRCHSCGNEVDRDV